MNTESGSSTTYYVVFFILLLLLTVAVVAGQFDLGIGNLVIALAVAVAKAGLIACFFMHLRTASVLVRLAAFASLLWLSHLFILTFADYMTRGWNEPGTGGLAKEQHPQTFDRTEEELHTGLPGDGK